MHEQIQKLLLMGPAGAGKTCMRSIIFDNYLPRDTLRLAITISHEESRVRLLNNMYVNLWDCGGQQQYVAEYLNRQRECIFRNVGVLLFVFDISSMSCEESDVFGGKTSEQNWTDTFQYFREAVQHVRTYSPQAKVFVLLHKMDIIQQKLRSSIFESRKREILKEVENVGGSGGDVQFFATSIYDDTLYLAYSNIVRSLIPHCDVLTRAMEKLLVSCNASEVALYERGTFLCLTYVSKIDAGGADNGSLIAEDDGSNRGDRCSGTESRTTKVSETVKHFKLSCMNNATSLEGYQMTTTTFTALLHPFTSCTYVLIFSEDTSVNVELHRINVLSARWNFEQFLLSGDSIAEEMRKVL
ncbi:ras-family member, GTP-binding protein, putative [Trypanosoma brucei gambiense DAL972]|uniref:Ras-family member, GTP-binding protein, putative n=2 Tax=Trypanosoma brucei TaxID=5691 RepID=D0A6F6_TRYB9|nr:ras-family member, GTP-binding protein, putative [Trypanosoma brucei gambiense DAL972]RHW67468.1 ras-like small GTPase [Trypanosoma brucei equiperdum]CBH17257.1 ras-family member, GTP-binding protein, putative [Trypanosoma brucei gambiense DAL972]|eukprot:XP_011779521.1 ras-family member, GTP-binding protein, putative [Trypanosoma brucei gambiense DAL972]